MSMTALELFAGETQKNPPLDAIKKPRAKFSSEITSRRRGAIIAAHKAAKSLKIEFGAKLSHPARVLGAAGKILVPLRY